MALSVALAVACTSALGLGHPARAEWRRTSDIELNTAYTLEESTISVGILSPLTVGVTESFQASIHPLLLLLGQPSLALRLRLNPVGDVTVAINLAGAWSFIRKETEDGLSASQAAAGEDTGFPGSLQLGATVTFAASKHWLVSVGAGPAADFLGGKPIRGMAELHASVHWLPAPRHLVMLQANGYLDATHSADLLRPAAQLVYTWAATSRLHLVVGIGLGDWVWEEDDGTRRTVRVFPLADLIFRF
ncbi:MAG: hypothetical protein U1F43_03440 [Myxococcota bacterium]